MFGHPSIYLLAFGIAFFAIAKNQIAQHRRRVLLVMHVNSERYVVMLCQIVMCQLTVIHAVNETVACMWFSL